MKNILVLFATIVALVSANQAMAATIPISGKITVCKGDQETYTISPTAGVVYTWSVTGGSVNTSNQSSVTITWGAAGIGKVEVSGMQGGSEVEGGELNVTIESAPFITSNSAGGCNRQGYPPEQPDPDSTACIMVCEGAIVTFYANSNSANAGWSTQGAIVLGSYGDSIKLQYNTVGFYSLSVTAGIYSGCNGEDTRCIEVIPGPDASFEVVPFSGSTSVIACRGSELQFKDLSTANGTSPIISWQWDFGDGYYSTARNPSHIYANEGVFEATLTVENACHCKSTYTVVVDVRDMDPLIVKCASVSCENQESYYNVDPSTGCGTFDWDVIGGSFVTANQGVDEVGILWDNVDDDGFGYVMVYDIHCGSPCEGPTVLKIPVIKSEGEIQGPTQICEGGQYLYRLPQWPATDFKYTVDGNITAYPSDQPNEVIIVGGPGGSGTIRFTYSNGLVNCGGKALLDVEILPLAKVTGPVEVCTDSTYNYKLSNNFHGDWELFDNNGSLVAGGSGNVFNVGFYSPGKYSLYVSDPTFCSPDPLLIEVLEKPTMPTFITGPDTICVNVPFSFQAGPGKPGTTVNWAISGGTFSGGATTSSGGSVSATFTGSGPYKVKVWRKVRNGLGCISDTLTKTLIPEGTNPGITGSANGCANTFASYQAAYTRGELYEWSVTPQTIGSISSGNGSANVVVQWNSISTPQFADIILKVRKCGVTLIDTFTVYVVPSSNLTISAPSIVCRDEPVPFSLSGTPISSFSSVEWDFGDGGTFYSTTSTTATHRFTDVFSNDVNYVVNVKVTNPNGCITTYYASHSITVQPAPVANISPKGPIKVCETVQGDTLYALVQSGIGSTVQFDWFRNGTLVGNSPKLYYTQLGEYYCVVTGNNGCTDTTNIVVVYEDCDGGSGPKGCAKCTEDQTISINLSYTNTGCGEVQVNATYSPIPYTVQFEHWDIDGAYTSFTPSPQQAIYTFDKAGMYRVYFTVCYYIDKDSILDSLCSSTEYIDVINPYEPKIKYDINCLSNGQYSVTILDHSNYHPNTPIDNYSFYVGMIGFQSGPNTSYTTTLAPGSHAIQLQIEGSGLPPCVLFDTIDLPDFPVADFSFNFDWACMEYPIAFTNLSTPATGLTYEWDFFDGAKSTIQHPFRAYASGGPYDVKLTVTNSLGCSHSITKTVNVTQKSLLADPMTTSPNPAIICEGGIVTLVSNLQTASTNPSSHVFQPDSLAVITHPNNSTTVLQSGSYFVTLWDANMCYDVSASTTVEFVPNPPVSIEGPDDICEGDSIRLFGDAGEGSFTYLWTQNGSPISTDPNITVYANAVGSQNFVLTVTRNSPITCSSVDLHSVEVHALPSAPTVAVQVMDCDPYTFRFTASASEPGVFNWSDGQVGSEILVGKGGEYTLTFINDWGCRSERIFYVPKSPEEFIWIYPLGCYELCFKQTQPERWHLPDPIIPFADWHLNDEDDTPWSFATGYSSIPNMFLEKGITTIEGTYTFTLATDDCEFTSRFFDLDEVDCQNCQLDVVPDPVQFTNNGSLCRNEVTIFIAHNGPQPIPVSLNARYGILIPATVMVPSGGAQFTFEYIPSISSSGATDSVYVTSNMYQGPPMQIERCYGEAELQLPNPICANDKWYKRAVANPANQSTTEEDLYNRFELAPNPAWDNVSVMYYVKNWTTDTRAKVEVYDLRGAKMAEYQLDNQEGNEVINTKTWKPSVYIVVLRVNGEVNGYKRLVIHR